MPSHSRIHMLGEMAPSGGVDDSSSRLATYVQCTLEATRPTNQREALAESVAPEAASVLAVRT